MFRMILFLATLATALGSGTPSAVLESYLGFGYDLVLGNPVFLHPGEHREGEKDLGLTTSRILTSARRLTVEYEEAKCETKSEFVLTPGNFRSRIMNDMVSYKDDGASTVNDFAIYGSTNARDSFPLETLFVEEYRTCTDDLPHSQTEPEVTDYFMYRVCTLPEPAENVNKYHEFINEFRTSVIMTVELGHMEVTRYSSRFSQIPELVEQLQKSEPILYRNGEGTISRMYINITEETLSALDSGEFKQQAQVTRSWKVGESDARPAVVRMVIMDVWEVLEERFWPICRGDDANKFWNGYDGCCERLPELRTWVREALAGYPNRLQIQTHEAVTDSYYRVYWPRGTYSMIQSVDGCPAWTGFSWKLGTVTHTQGSTITTAARTRILPRSFAVTIEGGQKYRTYLADVVNQQFCTKAEENSAWEGGWPRGSYCINKYGDCPNGFAEGWIWFDDINLKNENSRSGVVPDGVYNRNTQLYYCCRSDGAATSPVILPLHRPFILLRYGGTCQAVRWAKLVQASVFFDASWGTFAHPYRHFNGGAHPDNEMSTSNNNLFYCYYTLHHPQHRLISE